MEKSLAFYCDVLGFKKLFELHDSEDRPWIVYLKVRDGQFIELFYNGKHEIAFHFENIGYSHLCLEVDDIHEIANHLKSKGIPLMYEPNKGLDHNYQCWAQDPDGNRIEFMQMSSESPQMKL